MSNIFPNGQIRFLANVPLDITYEDSIDFLSEIEQRTYFLGIQPVHTTLNATRIRDGVIAVNALSDNLLTANYLMFQNTNFSNKWFYAFITNIEYVNNNMSHVYYQIDDIQSWMFDTELKECFIEREHTTSDGLFEHLVDEGFNVKEYIKDGNMLEVNLSGAGSSGMSAVMFSGTGAYWDDETQEYVVETAHPRMRQGLITGTFYEVWNVIDSNGMPIADGINRLGLYIDTLVQAEQSDSIVACILFPTSLINTDDEGMYNTIRNYSFPTFTPSVLPTLDGYVPKNKKMYNSPYCLFSLITSDGQRMALQPEYFSDTTVPHRFQVSANVSPNPSILISVLDYKNKSVDYEKSITLDIFPQIPFSIDGYKAWVASGGLERLQNQTSADILSSIAVGGMTVLGAMGGTAVAGPFGTLAGASTGLTLGGALTSSAGMHAGVSLAKTIQNEITTMDYAKKLPADVRGSSNATPLVASKDISITTCIETINSDMAKSLDEYMTMFGYRVNKIKTPSRRNRPHYTYIKTKGCKVTGGAPADAIERIKTIYDNGIRFWTTPSEIGDYSVNNAPV